MPELDITAGLTILGHIVYRLLEIKYPYPAIQIPPPLPPFQIASTVIGLQDLTLMPLLKELLDVYKVVIFEAQTAINYCLKEYQKQMLGIDDIQIQLQAETIAAMQKVPEPPVKIVSTKKDGASVAKSRKTKKGKESSKKVDLKAPPKIITVDNETQTPVIVAIDSLDDYLDNLTEPAILGKYAYEAMCLGHPVNDYMIAKMILEYLKTLTHAGGWVLFGYPMTLLQASILETTITAKPTGSYKS